MELKAGARARSAVCATEVIVVRAPAGDVDLRCGGQPMTPLTVERDMSATPDPAFASGSAIGKRYADEEVGLELLITKPGVGSISLGSEPMALKDAKPLPSSD